MVSIQLVLSILSISAINSGYSLRCEKTAYPPKSSEILEEFVIDLDADPTLRFEELILKKSGHLKTLFSDIRSLIRSLIGETLFRLLSNQLPKIAETLPHPYREEIQSMTHYSGLPLADMTLYNIFYEMFVLCTSVVAEDQDGNVIHGRNLDNGALLGWDSKNHTWKVTEILRPLTVLLNWKRRNETVFKSVSFAGYIGVLTAVKENKFSFSLDKRMALNNGIVGMFEWMILKDHDQHWVTLLPREVLEKAEDFESAKAALSKSRLIAPVYYILAGVRPKEAAIITRDRDNVNFLKLGSSMSGQGSWFLVETNYDHWKAPPFFDNRRTPAVKCLSAGGPKNANFKKIYNVLSTKPVLNKGTVYTALMQAKTGMIRAWLRFCPDPCSPW